MDSSKRTKELPMIVPEVSTMGYENPKLLSQSRESEMYKAVEITCCLRAVLVLAPNPT